MPAGFEPANLGSSGEYDNHWTTKVDDKIANPHTLEELKDVSCVKLTISEDELMRVNVHFLKRCQKLVVGGGQHFQYLLL